MNKAYLPITMRHAEATNESSPGHSRLRYYRSIFGWPPPRDLQQEG
jgi:hypothetical protein